MPPETQTKANILLVDDNANNLLALEAMLEGLDQNLVRAESGAEALRRLLDEDYAVILMDVQMPEMDGFETAELIRGRDRTRHLPIIFLTAFERTDAQLMRGYTLGAVDFLFKPIVPEILRSKVSVFVELHRKSEEIKRQAELLRATQQKEHERALLEQRQALEMERLRAEAAKEKKIAAELAEADRRKDEFLAMLGHELRNPLAPLLHALHVIRLPDADGASVLEAAEIAERQVRHLARLVDDLLDVSRVRSGKIQLRKERIELTEPLTRAVEAARPLIASRRHELTVSLPERPLPVQADAARMEQVLVNLLNNAAKYTEPGGQIALAADREGDEATIRVRDNGVGISPELLPRIFDLFAQEDRSLDRSQGGLGIGLTLVRSLVEMHGGTVQVSSPGPGQGSEFIIRLPLANVSARDETLEDAQRSAETDEGSLPKRLLIVDDNADGTRLLARLARSWGIEPSVAHDGPSALALALERRPEVILLDIGLPGMDGYQVARELRKSEGMEDVVLLAMTGYGRDDDLRRSAEAGINGHLTKPVEPEALREILRKRSPAPKVRNEHAHD